MDKLRRTMMFVPGANPGMLRDAPIYGADAIMFDLEDAVSLKEKDTARMLVYSALKTFDYSSVETVVRVNALDAGGDQDVEAMVLGGINVIRLPKTETAQDIIDVDAVITAVEAKYGIKNGTTHMMAAIESAEGVLNAREIAQASPRMIGIALGAEDYLTSQHTHRSADGAELSFARNFILHAAREAGINSVFAHALAEVQKAREIVAGLKEAEAKGAGVVSVNGQMVDKPVVERAQYTIALAKASGMEVD